MDRADKKSIIATLLRAGRKDLVRFVIAQPSVGQSWDSIEGKKTIVKIEGDKVFVTIEGRMGAQIYPLSEIESEIKFETRQYESRKGARDKAEKEKAKELEEQKAREDTHGFADKFPAMRRAKIIQTLLRQVKYKGSYVTVKEMVEDLRRKKYEVKDHPRFKRIAQQGEDGSFFDQKTVTKTGLDYLQYLNEKNVRV